MPHPPASSVLLMSMLLLAGCSKPPEAPPAEDASATTEAIPATDTARPAETTTTPAPVDEALLGTHHWRLQSATDAQGRRIDVLLVRPEQPIQLDLADGRIRVTNACNGMSGDYQLLGDEVRIGDLVGTKMGCIDEAISNLDNEVRKRLQNGSRIALLPGTPPRLEWRTPDGDLLRFTGEATSETRFGGPGETVFLEVAAKTVRCLPGLTPHTVDCLQVRELHYDGQGMRTGEPGPWQPFSGGIEGYTHEPGIRTVLRIKRYPIAGAQMDQPQTAYVFEMQIESESVAP
jgi:heat shock protein HslJ